MSIPQMDWGTQFRAFFEARQDEIAHILDAGGCRECWLQGEFYLAFRDKCLKTNVTSKKYDLRCEADGVRPMIAEIKICGGDYSPKMQGYIEDDVRKLVSAGSAFERYMILVIDTRIGSKLRKWLSNFCPDVLHEKVLDAESEKFTVRIWKITASH